MGAFFLVGANSAGFEGSVFKALCPAPPVADPPAAPEPGPRLYFPPTREDFQALREKMENEWVPELCRRVALDPARLPVVWDADFLYGPKDSSGADTYVLCEINVSSVFPFPDDALAPLAAATLARLRARSG